MFQKNQMRKLKTKKRVSPAVLIILLFFSCCSSFNYTKLRLEIPTVAQIPLDEFDRFVLGSFLVKKQTEDIDLNKEIRDYLAFELEKDTQKEVSLIDLSLENEEQLTKARFWQQAWEEDSPALLITGVAEYSEEVRKALLRQEKKQFEDPFPSELQLSERKFYTLILDLYIVDARTGKIAFQKQFKQTQAYKNPNQTAYFAFFDLIQKVKETLFRQLLGSEKTQERYLIR